MRVRGAGGLYKPKYRAADGTIKESGVYWWRCGSQRCSTGHRSEEDAQSWALERLVAMRRGHLVGHRLKSLTWDDVERMLMDRWTLDGRKGMLQSIAVLKRLKRTFAGWRLDSITTDQTTAYAVRRRQQGGASATVNLELAILRRGFTLAKEAGRIDVIPIIHRLPASPPRTGTVEAGDFEAILARLPPRYIGLARFIYLTGWRSGEARTLMWRQVDIQACEVRLETSKTNAPRLLRFTHDSPIHMLLEDQWTARKLISPYVFPGRMGKCMDRTAWGKAWRRACVDAGVPRALIHDLRRTMVRDMRRAGVPLAVAMGTVGHASLQVHQGYSVVAREDQEQGLAQVEALRAGEPVQRRLVNIGKDYLKTDPAQKPDH